MRPSIRTRLLVLTTTVISLVVISVAVIVWLSMSRSLRQQLDQTLRAQALAIASRLEDEYGGVLFEWEGAEKAAVELFDDALVQIRDEANETIFASPSPWPGGLGVFDTAWTTHADGVSFFNSGGQDQYRIIEMRLTLLPTDDLPQDDVKALRASVWVARSTVAVASMLTQLAWTLAGVGCVSILAALVGGYLIARHGVGPIVEVSQAIAQVAPEHPRLDLDLQRVPVELDPMISKTDDLLRRIDRELERQRQLTADIAHDLRTPVAGVRTLLDVCVQRDRNVAEYVETIHTARGALRQLSQLLDNVLTLARLDAGAEVPQSARVRIADVIRDATELVQPAAAARGVRIECENGSDVQAWSDSRKLVKILANLLSNAVHHSPAGGAVHIEASTELNHFVVAVRDNGPGISADLRDSIFDRFVRGDAARSLDDEHHGLGLPIARGLARLMGGDVKLASLVSQGTEFQVRLPIGLPPKN